MLECQTEKEDEKFKIFISLASLLPIKKKMPVIINAKAKWKLSWHTPRYMNIK